MPFLLSEEVVPQVRLWPGAAANQARMGSPNLRHADYHSAETGSGADGPVVAPAGWETIHGALKREEAAP